MSIKEFIYEQHFHEASFLWSMRDRAVSDPLYNLAELCELDERVEAHLDGLRLGGDEAWLTCRRELEEGEAGEAFTLTALAVHRRDMPGLAKVLDAVAHDVPTARGIVSAIGWVPWSEAKRVLPALLFHRCPPQLHYLGIAGSAAHRMDPGHVLAHAIHSKDLRLKERGLKAVGECRRKDLLPEVMMSYRADDERCRFAAAWTGALLGDPSASEMLWWIAQTSDATSESACDMLMRLLLVRDANLKLQELRRDYRRTRAAIAGAAALGEPSNIRWLLGYLQSPEIARFAAAAISQITGLDLREAQMEAEPPEGFEAGPTDDPDEDQVALDPDESLPWPNPEKLGDFWRVHAARFKTGQRYLLGKPMTSEWLEQVLRGGHQSARASVALELSRMHPGRVLTEVRAPGFRQIHHGGQG